MISTKMSTFSARVMGLVALLCCISGCSDPEFPAEEIDGGAPTSTVSDPGGTGGGATCTTQGWTCDGIGQCASACGVNMGCINSCSSKGCAAARGIFDQISNCSAQRCLSVCIGGNSDSCQTCTLKNCAKEAQACESSTCPKVCSTAAGGSPGADGGGVRSDASAAAPATASCFSIYECVRGCGILGGCASTCRALGCQSARSTYDKVEACARSVCSWECLFLFSPQCMGCVFTRCAAPWKACEASTC